MSGRAHCISIFVILCKSILVLSHRDGSLIFVIDNTVSMAEEIKQLQDGFDSILDVIVTNSSQIENVVLVTFNDPDWSCPIQEDKELANKKSSVISKSMDRKVLKSAMNSITTHGGGDGPEYSLTGILDALRNSNSNSYMFVFTDASPKDHQLTEGAKCLAQSKGTQIFFVLTPNCNAEEAALDPYYDIATATFGSVFRLREASEVQQIMNFAREMSSGERTILLAKFVPGGLTNKATFTVHEQIEDIVILLSGENVILSPILGEKITWLNNIKVVKLKNAANGNYDIFVGDRAMTSVLVYGITNSTFEYAFYKPNNRPDFKNEISKSCVIGTQKYLAVLAKNKDNMDIESVRITDLNDNLIRELQLKKMEDFYTTDLFMQINSSFLISVKGKLTATDAPTIRIARTPIFPYIGPKIEQKITDIAASETSLVVIECKILESKPEPNITWQFRSTISNEVRELPDKGRSITIGNVSLIHTGYYTCTAQNIFGIDSKTVKVSVLAKPVVSAIISEGGDTIDYNSSCTLTCKVTASPKPSITWEVGNEVVSTNDTIQDEGAFNFASNLIIQQTKRPNEYRCKVSNAQGEAVRKYSIKVNYPFKNNNTKEDITIPYDGNITLNCVVESSVALNYEWFKSNGTKLITSTTDDGEIVASDKKELKIYKVTSLEEIYVCKTSITGDEDIYTIQYFIVKTTGKSPVINQSLVEITVNETSSVTLECKILEGIPEPKITWRFLPLNKTEIDSRPWPEAENSTTIENVGPDNEGIYTCTAENLYGSAINIVNLTVAVRPQIKKSENYIVENKESHEGSTPYTIKCRVEKGKPTPKIQWFQSTIPPAEYENIDVSPLGSTEQIQVNKSGTYKCTASNSAGEDEKIVEFIVTDLGV